MTFWLSNRALLRGMLAGAVVLTGTACSRADKTESGRDSSAAVLPDTSSYQPSGGTATGAVSGTDTAAVGDTASTQSTSPRAETAPPSDKDAAGYRSMERDTANVPAPPSDSARGTAATAETSSIAPDTSTSETSAAADTAVSTEVSADTVATTDVSEDTTVAGYVEMARDTSTVADQADTVATPTGDVALEAAVDTSAQANAEVSAEAGVAAADAGDTTGNADRIRPPEDSTELLGDITTDEVGDETADEQVVRPEDREAVAASETPTDEVGAAAVGGDVTGADAVALMSRQGVRCEVVDPEANAAVRWEMSSTPVTLNPCGMGSMNPSRIWTAGQRDSGTAGQ